jgi:hypothetical protein
MLLTAENCEEVVEKSDICLIASATWSPCLKPITFNVDAQCVAYVCIYGDTVV